MQKISIKVKKISDQYNDIPLPEYETEGASGMDIRDAIDDEFVIKRGSFPWFFQALISSVFITLSWASPFSFPCPT